MTKVHYDNQVIGTAPLTTGTSSAYIIDRPNHTLDASVIYFQAHIDNFTWPVTANVGGTGTFPIVYDDNTNLVAGEIKQGGIYSIVYQSTLAKYILQGIQSPTSKDPDLFVTKGQSGLILWGNAYTDDKNSIIWQYWENVALFNSVWLVKQKLIPWPILHNQIISFWSLGISPYGGTMIYQWKAYILDPVNGNNVRYVDYINDDIVNVANWGTVTVGHTRTYTKQSLLGIHNNKVYILDYDGTGAVVKRFWYWVSNWTYEADQFIALNPVGGPILGTNAFGVANSQGITIKWILSDLWMITYDYAGDVINSYGNNNLAISPGSRLLALPNTQYSSFTTAFIISWIEVFNKLII
jgi:hypothetical protein